MRTRTASSPLALTFLSSSIGPFIFIASGAAAVSSDEPSLSCSFLPSLFFFFFFFSPSRGFGRSPVSSVSYVP